MNAPSVHMAHRQTGNAKSHHHTQLLDSICNLGLASLTEQREGRWEDSHLCNMASKFDMKQK